MNTKLFKGGMAVVGVALILASYSVATTGDTSAVENSLHSLGYTVIPLRKTALNEYEVNGTLNNGKPITMLLHFQSNNTIFNVKRLDEIGIKYEKTGREFEVNGDNDDLYMVRTDSISIGDGKIGPEELMCIDFTEFKVFDDYRATGFLGRDFLIKYNAIIDFANQKLYLKTS